MHVQRPWPWRTFWGVCTKAWHSCLGWTAAGVLGVELHLRAGCVPVAQHPPTTLQYQALPTLLSLSPTPSPLLFPSVFPSLLRDGSLSVSSLQLCVWSVPVHLLLALCQD
jgi:hypothetical protein